MGRGSSKIYFIIFLQSTPMPPKWFSFEAFQPTFRTSAFGSSMHSTCSFYLIHVFNHVKENYCNDGPLKTRTINLPFVLCEYKMSFVTFRKDHKLQALQNEASKTVSRLKKFSCRHFVLKHPQSTSTDNQYRQRVHAATSA